MIFVQLLPQIGAYKEKYYNIMDVFVVFILLTCYAHANRKPFNNLSCSFRAI